MLKHYSMYTSSLAVRLCSNNGAQANLEFLLKSYLKVSPFAVLVSFFTVGVFVQGYIILVFEQEERNSDIVAFSETIQVVL